MNEMIGIVSWNVQGEFAVGPKKTSRQLEFIEEHFSDVDLFLFQAVNYERTDRSRWGGQLGDFLSYFTTERGFYCEHTADWAHELLHSNVQPYADITTPFRRCTLTASRWPIERTPLTLRNGGDRKPVKINYYYTTFPTGLLVCEIDTSEDRSVDAEGMEAWNAAVPNGAGWHEEKIKAIETLYSRICLQNDHVGKPVILGGDFNAPKREGENGRIVPHGKGAGQHTNRPFYGKPYCFQDAENGHEDLLFERRWKRAERILFDPTISDWSMRDAYWAAENSQHENSVEDYTHLVHNKTPPGKRLDHILLSDHFDVECCEILNGVDGSADGLQASDHAPVLAEGRINHLQ